MEARLAGDVDPWYYDKMIPTHPYILTYIHTEHPCAMQSRTRHNRLLSTGTEPGTLIPCGMMGCWDREGLYRMLWLCRTRPPARPDEGCIPAQHCTSHHRPSTGSLLGSGRPRALHHSREGTSGWRKIPSGLHWPGAA
jgi:hypothetical protein